MARRTAAEIAADLEAQAEADASGAVEEALAQGVPPVSTGKADFLAAKQHCASLGIDPEAVSDAVRQLSRKFKRGPLEILWSVADDEAASKSARAAAAMAIMPYLQGKPTPMKPQAPAGTSTGVMEVPVAQSMEQWMGIAGPSQAALKDSVRE